jgi:hypothetical protein
MKKHTEIQSKVLWLKNKFMKVFPIYIYREREKGQKEEVYVIKTV